MMEEEGAFDPNLKRIKDKDFEDFAPYSMLHIPIDRIPEDIQKRMVKVFSKHRVHDVRHWSRKLM